MGIPYYFYILTKKYDDILLSNINFKPDIIYFDLSPDIFLLKEKRKCKHNKK